MPAEQTRPSAYQPPLPDMPLIREQLLVQIEQRRQEGASRGELLELRRQYNELMGRP
jgi:hypothetical protein